MTVSGCSGSPAFVVCCTEAWGWFFDVLLLSLGFAVVWAGLSALSAGCVTAGSGTVVCSCSSSSAGSAWTISGSSSDHEKSGLLSRDGDEHVLTVYLLTLFSCLGFKGGCLSSSLCSLSSLSLLLRAARASPVPRFRLWGWCGVTAGTGTPVSPRVAGPVCRCPGLVVLPVRCAPLTRRTVLPPTIVVVGTWRGVPGTCQCYPLSAPLPCENGSSQAASVLGSTCFFTFEFNPLKGLQAYTQVGSNP